MGIDAPLIRKAVFLDRDGVINRAIVREGRPYPPRSADEIKLLPGIGDLLGRLNARGFFLAIVTNQPDVARGMVAKEFVDWHHTWLMETLPIDAIYACLHDDADGCSCRKPAPGLLLQAAREHHLDLAGSYMIGDRWRDIEAGRAAGCRTIFIDYGYAERRPESSDLVVGDVLAAGTYILGD